MYHKEALNCPFGNQMAFYRHCKVKPVGHGALGQREYKMLVGLEKSTMSAAAKRAVGTVAASRRVEARGGQRLNRQAWQDIRDQSGLPASGRERTCAGRQHSRRARFLFFHDFLPWQQYGWQHLSDVASINGEVAVGASSDRRGRQIRGSGGARSGWKHLSMAKRQQLKQH